MKTDLRAKLKRFILENIEYANEYEKVNLEKWSKRLEQNHHLSAKAIDFITDMCLRIRDRKKKMKLLEEEFEEKIAGDEVGAGLGPIQPQHLPVSKKTNRLKGNMEAATKVVNRWKNINKKKK